MFIMYSILYIQKLGIRLYVFIPEAYFTGDFADVGPNTSL